MIATGAGAALLALAMIAVALLTGRLFLGGFGAALYRRFDPAAAVVSMACGTAVLTLLSVGLSGVGFATRDLPPLVASLLLVPLAITASRARLDVLRPRGTAAEWLSLLAPLSLTVVLALLPLGFGGYSFGNDTYTYSAFSEWLQRHAYAETARWDPLSPVTGIPALWQSQGYDLGIAHWLALVQAAVRPASVLLVYPAVSTFGLVLLCASLWLAARQLLRWRATWAGAAALLFAAVPHALYWGHHNGFLQQAYALPLVIIGLVLLARSTPARWRPSMAALLALPFAFLASVYLPLLPLLGFAAAVAFAPRLLRARRSGRLPRLLWFVAAVAGFGVLYAVRDVASVLSPLHRFATSVAGGHVPWSATDFLQFALGTRVLAPGWVNVEVVPFSVLNRWLTPAYGLLVLAGLWLTARRARTQALAATFGLIALAAAWYALAVKDPWSGERGHTWNLFKLAQWAWPFTLLLGVAGLRALAAGLRAWRPVLLGLALVLPASQVAVHWPWSARFAATLGDILPGATLHDLPALKQRIQGLPDGTLLVVGRPYNAHRWLATAVLLLAYPRAIAADWTDSASVSNHPDGGEALYQQLVQRWDDPHVVPILAGFVPFQTDGTEPLGGGFARLLRTSWPRVVHVVNPAGLEQEPDGRPSFLVGKGRTKIVVFSPVRGRSQLALELRRYPGRPGTRLLVFLAGGDYTHRSVRLASEGPPLAERSLGGETSLRLPLELPRGLATIVLVVDEGRGELDAREPVTVVGVSLVASTSER